MYETFFGFKEKPFKLVPNPAYLFLSKSHEEALAHLNYALTQGDGFVEITGEVGTGKTTLCRAFLENLDGNTTAAYIFNPRIGPKQLIKTINDELSIKYDVDNTKDLIDKLNAFLMREKAAGKKVIVVIDEAQNLSRNVLEQLRLLSNLETSKEKLLQIILVGQPELSDILDSHELRQLGQRITLRYHLSPLTYKETVEYIQYRISIAAQKTGIKFDRSAFRRIYKYSRGIPRVINIACDRSLLTAFGLSQQKITGSIARVSIRELSSRGVDRKFDLADGKKALILFAVVGLVLFAGIFNQPLIEGINSFFEEPQPQNLEASTTAEAPQPAADATALEQNLPGRPTEDDEDTAPPQPKPQRLADYLMTMDLDASRYKAIEQALRMWKISVDIKPYLNSLEDDQSFFRLMAKPGGLVIHRLDADLDLLKRLNLPAILEFFPPGSQKPGYLTLSKMDGDRISFGGTPEGDLIETLASDINFYWSGIAYIPWKNFLSIWGTIPMHTYKDSVITLKLLLHDLGFDKVEMNADYDNWTRQAVEEIQAKYGIPVDGFVGPLTKIILYREKNAFDMPKLTQ